jgi:hypothetical protein
MDTESVDPPSPIIRIPYEILSKILSYLLLDAKGLPVEPPGSAPLLRHSPVQNLRTVNRTFRTVVSNLSFWNDPEFDPWMILPLQEFDAPSGDEAKIEYCKTLMADPTLSQTLGNKTHWKFRDMAYLQAVIEMIPSFSRTVTSITFRKFFFNFPTDPDLDLLRLSEVSPVNGALRAISSCSNLKYLDVGFHYGLLSLELLSHVCPDIETLVLGHPQYCVGSLESLSHLQTLVIAPTCDFELDYGTFPFTHTFVLPLASAESLTRFSCNHWPTDWEEPHLLRRFTDCLHRFPNITSLSINPGSLDHCQRLLSSNMRLIDFRLTVWMSFGNPCRYVTPQLLTSVLSSPFLKMVEILHIDVYPSGTDVGFSLHDAIEPIVSAIATELTSLRELRLDMPLHLRYCDKFSGLQHLKSLNWRCQHGDFSDGGPFQMKLDVQRAEQMATDRFLSGFADFLSKPEVRFDIPRKDEIVLIRPAWYDEEGDVEQWWKLYLRELVENG